MPFPRSPLVLAKLIVEFSFMKCYPVSNKSFQNLTRNTEHGSGTVTLSLSNIALLVLFSVEHVSKSESEGLGLGFMVETIPGDGNAPQFVIPESE